MDETWRIGHPRRASSRSNFSADDFADVFGGPPKTLLAHKFSRSGTTGFFYEDIFRSPEGKSCRNIPPPARDEGFYSDIFGTDDERKSRERSGSQSKANSSSEELSPRRPVIGDDVALSDFTSKLRPTNVNVPWRWNSSSTLMNQEHLNKQGVLIFPCNAQSLDEIHSEDNNKYKDNVKSIKAFTNDWDLSSPFCVVSSLCQEPEAKPFVHDHVLPQQIIQQDDNDYDDDEEEVMSSYVIEVNSNLTKEDYDCSASAIDEAIAWAKEKFQSRTCYEQSSKKNDGNEHEIEGSPDASEYHDGGIRIVQPAKTEREELDRDIRLWSSGKETNIRLLLSTLHHILWPESDWYAIPLMSLMESSQVKKAYQKARLCLHPDKLQQRGVTLLQKYTAEKAISILQDAWAAFIFEDVSFLPEGDSDC